MSNTVFDRLFSRAIIQESGCWEFVGARDEKGYGHIKVAGRICKAHRLAFDLCVGDIQEGVCVCHRCNNPPCVNPSHLYLDDEKGNAEYREACGRGHDRAGTANGRSKLADDQARQIYKLAWEGIYTLREIGEMFSCSDQAVLNIKHGRTWKHLWQEETS